MLFSVSNRDWVALVRAYNPSTDTFAEFMLSEAHVLSAQFSLDSSAESTLSYVEGLTVYSAEGLRTN